MPEVNRKKKKDRPSYIKLMEHYGFEFGEPNASKEAQAEECPKCGGNKLYLNVETSKFRCHKDTCEYSGNNLSFIREVYQRLLGETTDDELRALKDKRGWSLQLIKSHGIAWDPDHEVYMIPSFDEKEEVLGMLEYNAKTNEKCNVPGLEQQMFGRNKLGKDLNKLLFILEGPFDYIDMDQYLTRQRLRDRYDLLAVPSAHVFPPAWVKFLTGRKKARIVFDNDKAGRDGQARIAKTVKDAKIKIALSAMCWPADKPEKYDIGDLIRSGAKVVKFTEENCIKAGPVLQDIPFTFGNAVVVEQAEWLWANHLPTATFVSLSGLRGEGKSTISRYIAARCTAGGEWPDGSREIDPCHVIIFTSEDSESQVVDAVRLHDGDINKLLIYDIAKHDDDLDILEQLDSLEVQVKRYGVRLVIIDALNSFAVGDIRTDSKARRSLSGPLQRLARRTKASVLGLRNWGKLMTNNASHNALGATSLSDVARCCWNTRAVPDTWPKQYMLEFEKISNGKPQDPLTYTIEDKSEGIEAQSHFRCISWEKIVTDKDAADFENSNLLKKPPKTAGKKGSKKE